MLLSTSMLLSLLRQRCLAFVLALLLVVGVVLATPTPAVDVCVLGAGASGMYAAQTLKDAGKTVKVLDPKHRPGGNCYTAFLPLQLPNQINSPVWPVTLGVIIWPNITLVTDLFDRYNLPYSPFPVLPQEVIQNRDFRTGLPVANVDGVYTPEEFAAAFGYVLGVLYPQYPWVLDLGSGYPDVIPPELVVPFGDFIVQHNLQPLYQIYRSTSAGYASIDVPTYQALYQLRPEILTLLAQNTGLMLNNFCDSLYYSMAGYLGDAMTYNVDIVKIQRKRRRVNGKSDDEDEDEDDYEEDDDDRRSGGNGKANVRIKYRQNGGKTQRLNCDRVIVSYDQSLESMSIFDLDQREARLFSRVEVGIYASIVFRYEVYNPAFVAPLYWNFNPSNPFFYPDLPASLLMRVDHVQFGPLNGHYYGNMHFLNPPGFMPLTEQEIISTMTTDLYTTGLGNVVPESAEVLDFAVHQFNYGPSPAAAANGFWGKLRRIQGRNWTYYTGSMLSYEAQYDCWAHAGRLVAAILAE